MGRRLKASQRRHSVVRQRLRKCAKQTDRNALIYKVQILVWRHLICHVYIGSGRLWGGSINTSLNLRDWRNRQTQGTLMGVYTQQEH